MRIETVDADLEASAADDDPMIRHSASRPRSTAPIFAEQHATAVDVAMDDALVQRTAMNRISMPWIFAVFGRNRAMISSAVASRPGLGLSWMNIEPVRRRLTKWPAIVPNSRRGETVECLTRAATNITFCSWPRAATQRRSKCSRGVWDTHQTSNLRYSQVSRSTCSRRRTPARTFRRSRRSRRTGPLPRMTSRARHAPNGGHPSLIPATG